MGGCVKTSTQTEIPPLPKACKIEETGCAFFQVEGIAKNLQEINNTLVFDFKVTKHPTHPKEEGKTFRVACEKPNYKINENEEITIQSFVGLYNNKITGVICPTIQSINVKQSAGSAMLIAECVDKDYILRTADYVVEGIVDRTDTRWNDENTNIVTYVTLSVEKYVKGSALWSELHIQAPGGCVEDICEAVEDQPIFQQGKRVRIYFHKTENEFWIVCAQNGVEEI